MLQVLRIEQQIVRNIVFLQSLQATQNRWANNEVVIRFVLNDVAHADELRVVLKLAELIFAAVGCQVDPSDNAGDPIVLLSQLQRPAIFLDVVLRLHKD